MGLDSTCLHMTLQMKARCCEWVVWALCDLDKPVILRRARVTTCICLAMCISQPNASCALVSLSKVSWIGFNQESYQRVDHIASALWSCFGVSWVCQWGFGNHWPSVIVLRGHMYCTNLELKRGTTRGDELYHPTGSCAHHFMGWLLSYTGVLTW